MHTRLRATSTIDSVGAAATLPIELTCTGQLQPRLEMFGYGFVKQRALGVARVVEFGFTEGPSYGGVHRVMPAGYGPRGNTVFMNSIHSNPLPRQSPAALLHTRHGQLRKPVTAPMLFARRTRWLFLDASLAAAMAPRVAAILEQETGFEPRTADFLSLCQHYLNIGS